MVVSSLALVVVCILTIKIYFIFEYDSAYWLVLSIIKLLLGKILEFDYYIWQH